MAILSLEQLKKIFVEKSKLGQISQTVSSIVQWANISGKPSTFAPSAHTHIASEVTDLNEGLVGTKEVDETEIGDEKILEYDTTSGKLVYITKPSGTGSLNNYSATTDPTTGDDSGDGYSVGSVWINLTTDTVFQCTDATSTAAVWKNLSSTSGLTNNYSATTDPTTGDDSGDGYSVGSVWINLTTDSIFICADSTLTAAVWKKSATAFSTRWIWMDSSNFSQRSGATLSMVGNQRIKVWSFSGTAAQQVLGTFNLPADYAGGDLTIEFWVDNSGTSANNVVWNYIINQLASAQSIDTTAGEQNVLQTVAPSTTQYALQKFSFTTTVTVSGSGIGDSFTIMVQRAATDASDTNTAAMHLVGVKIYYSSSL